MQRIRQSNRRIASALGKVMLGIMTACSYMFLAATPASAAACGAQSTDYGSATTTISVPSTATYRIWTRMFVPDTTNNTYLLEIDGNTCYNIGGGSVTANTWVWVDWRDGNTASKTDMQLNQGNHTLKLIGNKPNVAVDRVVATSDLSCPIKDTGDNCNVTADTTPPTVSITAPASGATVSGSVDIQANASDDKAVSRVDFYNNSVLISSDTSSPYSATWNTAGLSNGSRTISAKAYDASGNMGVATVSVTVENGDKTAPEAPTNVQATATSYNKVHLSWTAASDNVGVTTYLIKRNGVVLRQVGAVTAYDDTEVSPTTAYSYTLTAFDAAGNQSAASQAATATTPAVPVTDTTPPSTPGNLKAVVKTSSQVDLTWDASTDNIGVARYEVYRASKGGNASKIASVTTTSFGDTGLKANTAYEYFVRAIDAAGNASPDSNHAGVTTTKTRKVVTIQGQVRDQAGTPIKRAKVTLKLGRYKVLYNTNRFGNYTIKLSKGGTYQLTYSARNYMAQSVQLQTNDGDSVTRDVSLKKN